MKFWNKEKKEFGYGKRDPDRQKLLSEWTLGEIQEYCIKIKQNCKECRFSDMGKKCRIGFEFPRKWDLSPPIQWTAQELDRIQAILKLYPDARWMKQERIFVVIYKDRDITLASVRDSCFPSLRPNQSVKLDEIIGGAK